MPLTLKKFESRRVVKVRKSKTKYTMIFTIKSKENYESYGLLSLSQTHFFEEIERAFRKKHKRKFIFLTKQYFYKIQALTEKYLYKTSLIVERKRG